MQDKIREEIVNSGFSEVIIRNSTGLKVPVLLSERDLILLSRDQQILYILSPLRCFDEGKIADNCYVINHFVYQIINTIHRNDEEKFLAALQYAIPPREEHFQIHVDRKKVYGTDNYVLHYKKVKDLLNKRKIGKLQCNLIETVEPEGKNTKYIWPV